jgi:hypothetical protein
VDDATYRSVCDGLLFVAILCSGPLFVGLLVLVAARIESNLKSGRADARADATAGGDGPDADYW